MNHDEIMRWLVRRRVRRLEECLAALRLAELVDRVTHAA